MTKRSVKSACAGRGRSLDDSRGTLVVRLAVLAGALWSGTALAGGYDTGERDWDFLFQQEDVALESAVRYFNPQRRLTDIDGTLDTSPDVDETTSFAVPRFSATAHLANPVRCMASYREPWAGYADYGTAWTYAASAVEQNFSSEDYGLTCALSMPLAMGQLSVIGGLSYQKIEYELLQFLSDPPVDFIPFPTFVTTNVSDDGYGWRTGLAFEIPEYACARACSTIPRSTTT